MRRYGVSIAYLALGVFMLATGQWWGVVWICFAVMFAVMQRGFAVRQAERDRQQAARDEQRAIWAIDDAIRKEHRYR